MLRAAHDVRLRIDIVIDITTLFCDLSKIANARTGNNRGRSRLLVAGIDVRQPLFRFQFGLCHEQSAEFLEHPADARIVELTRDGRKHRDIIGGYIKRHMIALPLFAHIT